MVLNIRRFCKRRKDKTVFNKGLFILFVDFSNLLKLILNELSWHILYYRYLYNLFTVLFINANISLRMLALKFTKKSLNSRKLLKKVKCAEFKLT